MADREYTKIAISDIGTQLFWFNSSTLKFEYALPVTAGADFGGDQESFEVPETDLQYIPKVGGRVSLNDTEYTINYTAEKYARALEIISATDAQTYMEVFNDGSAMLFTGTCAMPGINSGDTREISLAIVPESKAWVDNIYNISEQYIEDLDESWYDTDSTTNYKYIKIDETTIPSARQDYFASTSEDKPSGE